MQIFQMLVSGIYAEGHGGLTLRAQRWWERSGACLEGAERGLTQSGGGAESAGELVWRALGGLFGGAQRGVALAHGTEASSLRRAAYGNFFDCKTK